MNSTHQLKHRHYLKAMGIDLWRVRGERPTVVAESKETAAPFAVDPVQRTTSNQSQQRQSPVDELRRKLAGGAQPAEMTPTKKEKPAARVARDPATEPEFLLYFLKYPGLSMVLGFSYDAAKLPDPHLGFANEVNFALTGSRVSAVVTEMRWPMLKARHISQSKAEAEVIIKQHLSGLGNKMILFGDIASQYVAKLVKTRDLVQAKESDHYFQNRLARRALWAQLKDFRSGQS